MTNWKDWQIRYGILLGKRRTIRQKIKFLQSLSKDFKKLGYPVDTTQSSLKFFKTEGQNYYNLYCGDFKRAQKIIAVSYETPAKNFHLFKYRIFKPLAKKSLLVNLVPTFVIALIGVLSFLLCYRKIPVNGWLSLWGLGALGSLIVAFGLIMYFRNGVPNQLNFSLNSNAIILSLGLAKEKPEKTAFVFYDGGTTNGHGVAMLQAIIKKSQKLIFIEGITEGTQWQVVAPESAVFPEEATFLTTSQEGVLPLAGSKKDFYFDNQQMERLKESLIRDYL